MSTPQYITILGFLTRRPDLTEEQFCKHWKEVHAPLIVPWAIKHGIMDYTQIHTPSHIRTQFEMLSPVPVSTLAFDGTAEMKFENFERFIQAFADPYFKDVIEVDERNFLDKSLRETATLTMGTRHPIMEDGKAVVKTRFPKGSNICKDKY